MKKRARTPAQRNFVAKNSQKSGGGRHKIKKKVLERKQKHKRRLR
jgi:hypothetical protein